MQLTPPIEIRCLAKHPRWPNALARLRRSNASWKLRAVRDWDELVGEVLPLTTSLSLIEILPEEVPLWVRRITWLNFVAPRQRVVVIGSRDLEPLLGSLAEAGAIWGATSLSQQDKLVGLIDRFAKEFLPPGFSLRDTVFLSLPWPEAGAADLPDTTHADFAQPQDPEKTNDD